MRRLVAVRVVHRWWATFTLAIAVGAYCELGDGAARPRALTQNAADDLCRADVGELLFPRVVVEAEALMVEPQ